MDDSRRREERVVAVIGGHDDSEDELLASGSLVVLAHALHWKWCIRRAANGAKTILSDPSYSKLGMLHGGKLNVAVPFE